MNTILMRRDRNSTETLKGRPKESVDILGKWVNGSLLYFQLVAKECLYEWNVSLGCQHSYSSRLSLLRNGLCQTSYIHWGSPMFDIQCTWSFARLGLFWSEGSRFDCNTDVLLWPLLLTNTWMTTIVIILTRYLHLWSVFTRNVATFETYFALVLYFLFPRYLFIIHI